MLRRVLLLAGKEVHHILRDFRVIIMALGIPLVLLLLFGYALTMDVDNIPTLVVDQDHTPSSRQLVSAFVNSGYFTVVSRPDNADEVLTDFRRFQAKMAIIIPREYEKKLGRGQRAQAQVLIDGTDANIAAIARGYASAIEQTLMRELIVRRLDAMGLGGGAKAGPSASIAVKIRYWFNSALKSQWYLVPGLIAIIMSMMSSMLTALAVSREWENGTMEQLLVTPARGIEIILGKLLPYFVIGMAQMLLIAAMGILLFKVPLRGSLGMLFGLSSLFLVGGLGWGLMISVIARSQQLSMMLAIMTSLLPSLLLSGFMTPIESMPKLIQAITYIFPARYYLVILRGLFLKDAPFEAFATETVALTVYALVVLSVAVLKFKTEAE